MITLVSSPKQHLPKHMQHSVLTIETIEASDLTQAQVDFSFVSIQLEIYKP